MCKVIPHVSTVLLGQAHGTRRRRQPRYTAYRKYPSIGRARCSITSAMAEVMETAWQHITALRKHPDQRKPPLLPRKETRGESWNPGHPASQPGYCHTQTLKSRRKRGQPTLSASHQPL